MAGTLEYRGTSTFYEYEIYVIRHIQLILYASAGVFY